jgi:metal-dependent amidase/aminoacylase/carboxypeptidase family protein
MDALPAIGHACGHNLIAISGVGVAIALKAALQACPHTSGKIVLLGTPGNEVGFTFSPLQLLMELIPSGRRRRW